MISTEQDKIGRIEIALRYFDSHSFDAFFALTQPGGVHQTEWEAFDHRVGLDGVARRARDLRDDRAVGAEQRVEERRLARVGAARDHEQCAFAQPLPLWGGLQQIRHTVTHDAPRTTHGRFTYRSLILLREIDVVGNQGFELEDIAAQRGETIGQAALELLQGAPPLRGRARIDEIGGRLGLQQIHLAVQDRAARELAGRRWPRARGGQCRQGSRRDDQAAMRRDLDEVLAGVGMRRGEAGGETIVYRLARIGMQKARPEHRARGGGVEGLQAAGGGTKGAAAREAD